MSPTIKDQALKIIDAFKDKPDLLQAVVDQLHYLKITKPWIEFGDSYTRRTHLNKKFAVVHKAVSQWRRDRPWEWGFWESGDRGGMDFYTHGHEATAEEAMAKADKYLQEKGWATP